MLQVRSQGDPVVAALVYQVNLARQAAAKSGSFFHIDVTSLGTVGDPMVRDGSGLSAASAATGLPANAADLPTSLVLANALMALSAVHAVDSVAAHASGAAAHLISDTALAATLAAIPAAVDLGTAETVANGLKTFWNAHFTSAGVHVTNDATNTIAAAAATTQGTTNTLLNAIKTAVVAHFVSAPAGDSILLTSP
jgi:hypothetical protein